MGRVNERKASFMNSAGVGRGGVYKPRPGRINLISKVCNTLRPRSFFPDNILETGDSHNVPAPDFPSDPDNRESRLFPTLLEPIHGSFPSGPEHIPVAAGNNDAPVLEQ